MDEDRFRRQTVETLAKRAGHSCSNPDCGALTSGPAESDDSAINVGEAAHIYGARPGAARFKPDMIGAERSDITNGIWLCCNCHKIIDSDPGQFSPELLFEWRRAHEESVSRRLGKTAERLRQKVALQALKGFENESYLAQQIVIDKPGGWEYRLTLELLRSNLEPVLSRWRALEGKLYTKPITRIPAFEVIDWFRDRLHETGQMPDVILGILEQITQSWGPPGVAGSASAIQRSCSLFVEACRSFLDWEERVRFTRLPDDYEELQDLLVGIVGSFIDKMNEIPTEMAVIFADDAPTGNFTICPTLELPDGWPERISAALDRITVKVTGEASWLG